jgi:hypothetical protein
MTNDEIRMRKITETSTISDTQAEGGNDFKSGGETLFFRAIFSHKFP